MRSPIASLPPVAQHMVYVLREIELYDQLTDPKGHGFTELGRRFHGSLPRVCPREHLCPTLIHIDKQIERSDRRQ